MKRPVTNVAAPVRQRLPNEAKPRGESFDYVASLFARTRFLARLSLSPHRDRLTLKGATAFAVWLLVHRPTRDLDFLGIAISSRRWRRPQSPPAGRHGRQRWSDHVPRETGDSGDRRAFRLGQPALPAGPARL